MSEQSERAVQILQVFPAALDCRIHPRGRHRIPPLRTAVVINQRRSEWPTEGRSMRPAPGKGKRGHHTLINLGTKSAADIRQNARSLADRAFV